MSDPSRGRRRSRRGEPEAARSGVAAQGTATPAAEGPTAAPGAAPDTAFEARPARAPASSHAPGSDRARPGPPGHHERPHWVDRVFAPYDIRGPKIRLGVIWFALEMGALYGGRFWLGVLFGLVAGVAGLQVAREWRRVGWQPSRPVALALPIAAAFGVALAGAVLVVLALLAVVAAAVRPRRRRRTPLFGAAGTTVRCALFPGLAAAMPVLVYRTSAVGALVFILVISAYEMGDFINGSEAAGPFAGPIVGMICALVVAFAVGVAVTLFEFDPFTSSWQAWVVGSLIAVCCPLSQMAASLVLPRAGAWAPALRRLDSYLLTGVAWLALLWSAVG